jgi:hypothetical protein
LICNRDGDEIVDPGDREGAVFQWLHQPVIMQKLHEIYCIGKLFLISI